MSRHQEIVKAVAAHAFWKVRLGQAVAARKADVASSDAKRDDRCEFGKWLLAPETVKHYTSDTHYRHARELHAKFHETVGQCVHEIERGHVDVAKKLLDAEVSAISTQLTREMMAWDKQPE